MEKELTNEEKEIIRKITDEFSKNAKFEITFDGLLKKWEMFATQCQHGYDDYIEEYLNDLSTRDLLQKIIERVPHQLSIILSTIILKTDDIFKNATISIGKSLVNNSRNTEECFWYKRIPKIVGDIFKDDIKRYMNSNSL